MGDALDAVDDKVGGGSAAADVHNVVSSNDAKVEDVVTRLDATEEVLGVDSRARRQGIGRRPVLDEYEVPGEGNDAYEDVEYEAKAVDDALDDVDDEVGGGCAAADVQDVVGGKDDQSITAVAKEDAKDAAEEDLGIDLHAKSKVTRREFAPEITTEVNDDAHDVEVGNDDAVYDEDKFENITGAGGASVSAAAFVDVISSRFAESWAEWKRSRLLKSWRTWKKDRRRKNWSRSR